MAAYDFIFEYPQRFHNEAKHWLHFFVKTANAKHLSCYYRAVHVSSRKLQCLVEVTGSLSMMQTFERELKSHIDAYLNAVQRPSRVSQYIIESFVQANSNGVTRITKALAKFVYAFRYYGLVGMTPLALSPDLHLAVHRRSKRKAHHHALSALTSAKDKWISGVIAKEMAVILSDHAIEQALKVKLNIPANTRTNFPDLLGRALASKLISGREAYRLKRLHRRRNKVQHAGARADRRTAWSMFKFYTDLTNRWFTP